MANIPFADIADLMNRLLDEAAEHRRRRCDRTANASVVELAKPQPARADSRATRAAA